MKLIKNLIANVIISGALLYFLSWMNWQLTWPDWQPTNIGIKITLPGIWNSIISIICAFLILWFIFRIFNSPIKRILKTLACPINFLTFWLASIIINVLVIIMFAYVVNTYSNGMINVELWQRRQTLILSFILSISITILTKIFK